MPNDKISKITLPNGTTYDIQDENVGIDSSYNSTTKTVTLSVGSLVIVDGTEY